MSGVMVVSAVFPGIDWAKEIIIDTGDYIINYLRSKGLEPEVLGKYMVRKPTLSNRLRRGSAGFIIYIGHGLAKSWTGSIRLGYDISIMGALVKDVNDYLLSNRIVYSCSCDSLRELGPSAVKKGCIAFIGFDRKCLVREDDFDNDNLIDVVDVLSVPVRMLINGFSVKHAVDAFKIGCLWYMEFADRGSEYYNTMKRNMEGIGWVGDGDAKLF